MKGPDGEASERSHAHETERSPRRAAIEKGARRPASEEAVEASRTAESADDEDEAVVPEDDLPEGLGRFLSGQLKQAGPYMDAVYGLVGAIFGLGLLGWFVDRMFGTAPRWLVAGVLTGVVVGMYGLGRVMLWRR